MNLFRAIIGGVKEIKPDKYTKHYLNSEHILLDVRNPREFGNEHIEGATNIPFNKLSKRLKELPKGQPIVCISRDGVRGREAAYLLQNAGYDVANMIGGFMAWRKSGGNVSH